MKNYIQLYHKSSGIKWENGKMVEVPQVSIEMCGSDGIMYYDARMTISNIVYNAVKRIIQMSNIHSDITGFKVYKNGKVVYSNVPTVCGHNELVHEI